LLVCAHLLFHECIPLSCRHSDQGGNANTLKPSALRCAVGHLFSEEVRHNPSIAGKSSAVVVPARWCAGVACTRSRAGTEAQVRRPVVRVLPAGSPVRTGEGFLAPARRREVPVVRGDEMEVGCPGCSERVGEAIEGVGIVQTTGQLEPPLVAEPAARVDARPKRRPRGRPTAPRESRIRWLASAWVPCSEATASENGGATEGLVRKGRGLGASRPIPRQRVRRSRGTLPRPARRTSP